MSGNTQFLRIARITGAHGLKGRLKIDVISDISDRFNPESSLYLLIKTQYIEYKSEEFIQGGKTSLLKLEGINDRDEALSFKGIEVFIDKKDAEESRSDLEENDFFYYDLVGCKVYLDEELFAEVMDIKQAGDGSILIIKDKSNKEHMIPFIESMVDTKKIKDGRIDIKPIDGLIER